MLSIKHGTLVWKFNWQKAEQPCSQTASHAVKFT
jgi:hypothetical protein